jgi:ribosomal protein L14E/L6E/L27E
MANTAVLLMVMLMMFGMMGAAGYFFLVYEPEPTAGEKALEAQLIKTETTKQALEEKKAEEDAQVATKQRAADTKKAAANAKTEERKQKEEEQRAQAAEAERKKKKPTKIYVAADDKINNIRVNGVKIDQPSSCTAWRNFWGTNQGSGGCEIATETALDDVVEFDVENSGNTGFFRCLIERDGKTYKTPFDFSVDPAVANISGARWNADINNNWTPALNGTVKAGMRDAGWAWSTNWCSNCTLVFRLTIK